MKPVTIVLPTYCPNLEVAQHLNRCVSDLFKNTPADLYDLIIVEQGDIEADVRWATIYCHANEPLGFSRAVNIGYRLARTEYICVLNNDVFVPKGWLELMLRDIEYAGILAPSDGPVATTGTAGIGRVWTEHWGSLYMLRRSLLDTIGLLDEDKLNYRFQDQDQSIRCYKSGKDVCRTSSVTVEHVNSATYSKMNKQAEEAEERAEMIRRHGFAEFNEWFRNQY